ncbi:MAG: pantetheine-phosphate adenylyltransferase [Acidobacteria bacterium]|nr:pantetheine-phosphate adenylyltransferase [Acidobacteriota bacterium]
MTRVLYPGSFDPIHNGHLEIIETASRLFDEVVVAAMRNPQKGEPLFTLDERREMLEESVAPLGNVTVTMFASLVVDLARDLEADFIVKGLRAVSDFESELQMAQMNKRVSGVDTLFIPSASGNSFLASKLLRELARFGSDVSPMVPAPVARRLQEKYRP